MSGTSVDSLDAVLVDFSQKTPAITAKHSEPIPTELQAAVQALAISGDNEIQRLKELDQIIANLSALAVKSLCQQSNTERSSIKAIGSHGQTIRHYPPTNHSLGYSLQVGDPNIIAEETGITTVADFRRRDIAAGGQGAPLVPAFHKAIFGSTETERIILNLGGIANISYLPLHGDVAGYDTGPANGLMDSWIQKHRNLPFDENGTWASSGKTHLPLLEELMSHPYLSQPAPKSTGRETFNLPWLEQKISNIHDSIKPEDVQATLLDFTAQSISNHIELSDPLQRTEVYACGGGSHNQALMQKLQHLLASRLVLTTEALGIKPDWVEAVAFAWLAKQTMEHRSGNLPTATGAKKAVVLGGIYLA